MEQPQDERKAVQKRTFTRWMNVFLQRHDPPAEVHNLFTDLQDGRILMVLLEELSGCKLLYRFRSSSHRIFRLNNISKALAFLDDRHVRLLGIDAPGVADGVPSVVLNLVWNIILYFQVKEGTGGLQRHLSSSLSSLSMSSYPSCSDLSPPPNDIGSYSYNTLPSKGRAAAKAPKYHGRAIKTLLQWVQRCTSQFGVEVRDFGKSWRNGLALLAMIKSINPGLIDLRESLSREPRENIKQAFMIAHHSLDIPPLLDPEDVMCDSPDEQSIITYVSMFLGHYSSIDEDQATLSDINIPKIPKVRSLETLIDNREAQASFTGFEKSNEQLLWKQWARRSSGGLSSTSVHQNGALTSDVTREQPAGGAVVSQYTKKKSKSRSVLQPPSPLDAGGVSQEIRSWMEKASDQGYSKPRADEIHFSLSSEEGIYTVSALDSDEEDAYSYILDLNKEVFQQYNQKKRQVPKVDEETAEEVILNGKIEEEAKHVVGKTSESSQAQDDESKVHRKGDLDSFKSTCGKMVNNGAAFDMEAGDGNETKGDCEEARVIKGQARSKAKEGGKTDNVENVTLVENEYYKRELLQGEVHKEKLFEAVEEVNLSITERDLHKKISKGSDNDQNVVEENDENQQNCKNQTYFKALNEHILTEEPAYRVREPGQATNNTKREENITRNSADEIGDMIKKDKNKLKTTDKFMKSTAGLKDRGLESMEHQNLTERNERNLDGGVNVHDGDNKQTPSCSATSQSYSEGGVLQSFTSSCDVTPVELETLLFLWILLYCCFILPQMNP
ncbi:uncharacterized protein LOC115414546 isoform X2 [Sphaeramia orbicularis]|uniref:uncharacterized protein LOC115414546 isoform X2 n=1 Tax=Sphaeramia orbicularis TaxID=375764 RepID=UPI001181439E|nr:uncharacterized protein LOC115414546 isoform X2 [Sphaeramia orbicularis]